MKKTLAAATLALVALLSGCATQVYKTEALSRPNQRFALISFGGLSSGLGMTEAEDQKLIASLEEVVFKELGQSKRFRLAAPSAVKNSRNYAQIKGAPTEGMYTLKMAPGYKRFDPRDEGPAIKKLMTELNLTGVVMITAHYSKTEKSAWVSGLLPIPGISGGVANGRLNFSIVAFNENLEVIWQDMVQATTRDGTLVVMGIANVGKLYPQLVDITQEATRVALKNLAEQLDKKV